LVEVHETDLKRQDALSAGIIDRRGEGAGAEKIRQLRNSPHMQGLDKKEMAEKAKKGARAILNSGSGFKEGQNARRGTRPD